MEPEALAPSHLGCDERTAGEHSRQMPAGSRRQTTSWWFAAHACWHGRPRRRGAWHGTLHLLALPCMEAVTGRLAEHRRATCVCRRGLW
eukprot:359869-Chlamydomonas_euryale.AAC.23